ncbi:50S ribosomal protein L24 [Candidatus Parvarchaeota archaeon]|uniref:Large ribosomal subunit protein uL24 n=1 Tax=Candidatus Acidifodinimicrobium mancum TaxID=2898728 RepID=A0A8T3UU63_9ARCH|nr:50S ribosomal protein L24 [Candidatus Acidifodinimicrobium mancum]
MKDFSKHWNGSKSPRKQRKYRANAPLNLKHRMVSAHLSKELRQQYHTRSFPIRKGDTVLVMRGKFKGSEGKVEKVYTKQLRVTVDSAKITSKKGTKIPIKIRPSALLIKELNLSDKLREKSLAKYGKAR